MIEIETKDKNGETVKDVKFIELFDENADKLNRPEYLWSGNNKTVVEPGETAKVELGTAAESVFLVYQKDKGRSMNWIPGNTEYSYLQLNNEKKSFTFPVSDVERG